MSKVNVPEVCAELQRLQRQRVVTLGYRNMIQNRSRALVACTLGYDPHDEDADKSAFFKQADETITRIVAGDDAHPLAPQIASAGKYVAHVQAELLDPLEKQMEKWARSLPVAAWQAQPEQRGFGLLSLAKIVGEAGDLSDLGEAISDHPKPQERRGYHNPARLWKRLGCAPHAFGGYVLMPATWRSGKPQKLPAEEWSAMGYSPRRRSLAYLIGEGLLKQNGAGPYRRRYDEAKAGYAEKHPERVLCAACKGTAKAPRGGKCAGCKGTGRTALRAHRHAMLLATKLLLKNLWIAWQGG